MDVVLRKHLEYMYLSGVGISLNILIFNFLLCLRCILGE